MRDLGSSGVPRHAFLQLSRRNKEVRKGSSSLLNDGDYALAGLWPLDAEARRKTVLVCIATE
jgi:hypothetical protein